jgi:hypothetical protein
VCGDRAAGRAEPLVPHDGKPLMLEFVADRLMLQVGYPKIYRSANPFPFMENMSLENKDNFFEKRVSTYAKATVGKDPAQMTFATNADF